MDFSDFSFRCSNLSTRSIQTNAQRYDAEMKKDSNLIFVRPPFNNPYSLSDRRFSAIFGSTFTFHETNLFHHLCFGKGMDEAKMDNEARYQELVEVSVDFIVNYFHCVLASAMCESAIRPCCPRNKSNKVPSWPSKSCVRHFRIPSFSGLLTTQPSMAGATNEICLFGYFLLI